MTKEKVIYALFDDGEQSVKKALEPLGYEVYSFGIQKKDTVINCDLTNLDDFMEKLDPKIFCKIHRSYIVNTTKITEKKSSSVIVNSLEIPISRNLDLNL